MERFNVGEEVSFATAIRSDGTVFRSNGVVVQVCEDPWGMRLYHVKEYANGMVLPHYSWALKRVQVPERRMAA